MPSLKTLIMALTAAVTLAAPTANANTNTTPSSPLAKRAVYYSAAEYDADYCGEAVPTYTYGSNTPLVADCAVIYQNNPGPGYWAISAAETNASADDRWVRLAASGTCAFEVRLSSVSHPVAVDYRFGTNDVKFYIQGHATASQAQNGRLSVQSGVYCRRLGLYDNGGMVTAAWRIVHS